MTQARLRGLAVSAVATSVFVPLMLFAYGNPFNFRYTAAAIAPLTALSALAAACFWAFMFGRRWANYVGLCIGVLGLLSAVHVHYLVKLLDDNGDDVRSVSGPDGYELVVVGGAGLFAIDPVYDVRIRKGNGLLTQETVVWAGVEEGAAPETVRFIDSRTVEVILDNGCRYRSTFNRLTLQPHPKHVEDYEPSC